MSRSGVQFSIDWLDGGENAAAEERATLCELKIVVGNDNACLFFDETARETFDSLRVPAVHLAEGIARDWWRIFGGRDRKQSLMPYRTGFVLPDLRFGCDGLNFQIEGHQTHCPNPGLRFWQVAGEHCTRAQAEDSLTAFVNEVVDKLASEDIHECEVALAWRRVCASREDPAEAAFCEAAGALDVDPYSIDDGYADFIAQASDLFSDEALIEFLAGGLRGGAHEFRYPIATLSWLRGLRSRRSSESALPTLSELRDQFSNEAARRDGEPAWSQGYRVASMLAKEIDVDGRNVPTPEALAKRLGGKHFQRDSGDKIEPGIRAVVAPDASIHLRDRGRGKFPWAHQAETFALARAIGSALCLPPTEQRVVNNLHDAEHQAVGRAFAAEFLAPIAKVGDMIADGIEEDEVAHEFKVSRDVVFHQLSNQERIVAAQAAP